MSNEREDSGSGVGIFVIMLPVLLVALASSIAAWFVARAGGSYRLVKLVALPGWFLVSNFIGALFTVAGGFTWAMIAGDREAFSYIFGNMLDLSAIAVWGPILSLVWDIDPSGFSPSIPVIHIIIYQLVLYIIFGHRVARQLACAIMDSALQSNHDPFHARRQQLANDSGYAKACFFYAKKGTVPPLSILSVWLSGGSPSHYF